MKRNLSFIPSDLIKEQFDYRSPEVSNLPAVYLGRNFVSRFVVVGLIPTLIHDAVRNQNIMITNPSPLGFGGVPSASGLVTQQVAVVGAGNSEALPIGVGNYMDLHLFLNITAIAAGTTWSFFNVVQDPVTLQWVDSQALIAAVTPAIVAGWINASFYANPIGFGNGIQFAIRWTLDAGAGAISFTVSYILKLATAGSSGGVSQIVYLGSNSGISVAAGYPLLENSEKIFQIVEGTQVWGIARIPVLINVLELT
jgi:hypothetical protein